MKTKRWLIIISLVLTLAVNFLANTLPINGVMTGEVSDQFPILFVPAGYVFSIWGLIYLALVAFAIYSVTPKGRADARVDGVAGWFTAANLFNAVWIFLWHYQQFPLTLIAMAGLLVSLLAIYTKLRVGLEKRSLADRLLVETPFSIYLGWITVATVANISQVLYVLGWRGCAPVRTGLGGGHAGRRCSAGRADDLPAKGSRLPAGAGLGIRGDLGHAGRNAPGGVVGPRRRSCAGLSRIGAVDCQCSAEGVRRI